MPPSTMRDHMKKDLNVRPYRPTSVYELSDGDMDRRYESCRALLDTFSNAISRSKVLFSDECAIYSSARNRNVVFWSKENRAAATHHPRVLCLSAEVQATSPTLPNKMPHSLVHRKSKVQSDNLMSYPLISSHEVDYVPAPA